MEENNPGLTLSKKTVIFSNGRMKSRVARSSKLQSLFLKQVRALKVVQLACTTPSRKERRNGRPQPMALYRTFL